MELLRPPSDVPLGERIKLEECEEINYEAKVGSVNDKKLKRALPFLLIDKEGFAKFGDYFMTVKGKRLEKGSIKDGIIR